MTAARIVGFRYSLYLNDLTVVTSSAVVKINVIRIQKTIMMFLLGLI